MDINIRTLQATSTEVANPVDTETRSAAQKQTDLDSPQRVTVVEVAGEVDTNTAPFAQEQILPLAQTGSRLILNLTKVSYMSSAGLRMLLSLYRQVTDQDVQVLLVGLSEEVQDTMSITGFLGFFKTCETLGQALAAFNIQTYVELPLTPHNS